MFRTSFLCTLALVLLACGTNPHDEIATTTVPPTTDAGDSDGGSDPCDSDEDGYEAIDCGGSDCNDEDPLVHPSQQDTCDGEDNDCDEQVDEDDACDCAEPPPQGDLPYSERVCISGGWFLMGAADDDPHLHGDNTRPQHRVFVSPFYMDAYEFTNERFIRCIEDGSCPVPVSAVGSVYDVDEYGSDENRHRTVTFTTRDIAQQACVWAGGRLPTEAEWERAAAGLGDNPRPFVHGNERSTCDQEVLWPCLGIVITADSPPSDVLPRPIQVGTKQASPEGLFDLGGNAREWVLDRYDAEAYLRGDGVKDPCVECGEPLRSGLDHIERGASLGGPREELETVLERVQARWRNGATDRVSPASADGFRCAYPTSPAR